MPSPFPGMDPYLEGDLWQEFHDRFANQLSAQLMPLLSPKYVALLAKRYVLDSPVLGVFDVGLPRIIYPDVHVVAIPGVPSASPITTGAQVDNSATSAITTPTMELPSPMVVPQLYVEIRDVAQRQLVTVIEVLSPANKHGEGAREYNERRVELLATQAHLLEIDLLRGGARITLHGEPTPAPYYVYLSRSQRRPFTQIWSVGLRDRLPRVPVPLLAPDPDVPLDLQAALDACFNLVGYERLLDYAAAPPGPALMEPDLQWVAELLHEAGLRVA